MLGKESFPWKEHRVFPAPAERATVARMAEKKTILIVDDHIVVRAGVCELLAAIPNVSMIEAATGHEALDAIRREQPSIVLLDIGLPDMSGLEVLKQIRALGQPATRVIMFSVRGELVYAAWALRLGAWGVVSKSAGAKGLIDAVTRVIEGGRYIEPEVASSIAFLPTGVDLDPLMRLSARELEMLRLLGEGCSLSDIAERLSLARKTVANCCVSLKTKLGLASTTALIRFSIDHAFLTTLPVAASPLRDNSG